MVVGLDKFKEFFREFNDKFVVIGGAACDVILEDSEIEPRATDDIDMILIVDKMTPEFGRRFWQFIAEGNYQTRERKRGEGKEPVPELFRFIKPGPGYPVRIELLSTHPDILGEPTGFHLTPIPVGEEISSLSAIIMDPDCYEFTITNSIVEDGLRVASPLSLICLKVRAFLNLTEEKKTNPNVRSQDIKKHRDDVFKLMAASFNPESREIVPETIKESLLRFVETMEASIPNQSLEASLNIDTEQSRMLVNLIRSTFEL